VDGGWGIDALLREETRPHRDLDLAVAREQVADCYLRGDLEQARTALAALAFEHDENVDPGLPARLVLRDPRGRQVDFHPLLFDSDGNGWQELGGGRWGLYPADGLAGEGAIAGRRVRCLTPALHHRFLLGLSWDDDDVRDLRFLGERFGLPLPPGLG
jgi:lincosamide nucleotidyltransferase A/C/D/E